MTIRGRRVSLRKAADRLPTKWFGAIGASIFLLLTAAFGGLREAPPKAVPEIAVGELHTNDEASIAIEQVLVANEVDGLVLSATSPKVVVLVLSATNRWDRPLNMNTVSLLAGIDGNVSLSVPSSEDVTASEVSDVGVEEGLPLDVKDFHGVVLTADMTSFGTLQPGVPARLAIAWPVGAGIAKEIATADSVEVTIYDRSLVTGTYLYGETVWSEPVAAARVAVTPEILETITQGDLDVTPANGSGGPPTSPPSTSPGAGG